MRRYQYIFESALRCEELVRDLLDQEVTWDEVKRLLVQEALKACNGNQTKAAEKLGMTRDRIRYYMAKVTKEAVNRSMSLNCTGAVPTEGTCSPTSDNTRPFTLPDNIPEE